MNRIVSFSKKLDTCEFNEKCMFKIKNKNCFHQKLCNLPCLMNYCAKHKWFLTQRIF
jgi:hypothetical protein